LRDSRETFIIVKDFLQGVVSSILSQLKFNFDINDELLGHPAEKFGIIPNQALIPV
jgi:hypothetical protein